MSLRLNDCTKTELLFIIKQFKFHCGSSGEYYLMQALRDVQGQRLKALYAEADRLRDISYRKRLEYIDLLGPYEGARLVDIPLPVLEAANAILKDAQDADLKWEKLMMKDVKRYE